MKKCGKCQVNKSVSEFSKNKCKPDGLQGMCRACKKETDALHYKNNKTKQLARNAALRKKYRQAVIKLKAVPCTDCKQNYPWYVMDFDHVLGDKIGNISEMAGNVSNQVLMDEIAKCEVVCSNCHRERTHVRAFVTQRPE